MQRRLLATTLIAAAALLAGTACSNGGTTAQTSSGGQSAGAAGTTDMGGDANAAAGSPEPGAVIGTTRSQLRTSVSNAKPLPIRMDIMRLRATGELVELELALTNEAPATGDTKADRDLEFEPYTLFSDASSKYDLSAVGLVDAGAQKVYLPARDNADKCLCTANLTSTDYGPGGTYTLTATFAGVPSDTPTVDVRIPHFPAVTGVRIQR